MLRFSTSSGKKFRPRFGLKPEGLMGGLMGRLIGVLGLMGVFGVRTAFGEAPATMLSKVWEAFAKNRMETAIALLQAGSSTVSTASCLRSWAVFIDVFTKVFQQHIACVSHLL